MRIEFPAKSSQVFNKNPFLKLVPEFSKLDNKIMFMLMLYLDPLSPIRHLQARTDIAFRKLCVKHSHLGSREDLARYKEAFIGKTTMKPLDEAIKVYKFLRPGCQEYFSYLQMYKNMRELMESKDPAKMKAFVQMEKSWSLERLREKMKEIRDGLEVSLIVKKSSLPPEARERVEQEDGADFDPNEL